MPFANVPKSSMELLMIKVEVAYVDEKHHIFFETVTINAPQSALKIIERSGILEKFEELSLDGLSVGLFSKKISLETLIVEDSRLELYRELTLSPMERRRLVAKRRKNNTSP